MHRDVKGSKRSMLERNTGISPELQRMHEIFGDPNCGIDARYEDGTCSKIVYDPAKMSFRERMEKQQHTAELLYPTEQPLTEQPTETEKQAETVYKFTHLINKTRRT